MAAFTWPTGTWGQSRCSMSRLGSRWGCCFPPGTGGLATPSSMAFGLDGKLYVSYGFYVNRYHPTTGNFLGRVVDTGDRSGYRYAVGIAWGPFIGGCGPPSFHWPDDFPSRGFRP